MLHEVYVKKCVYIGSGGGFYLKILPLKIDVYKSGFYSLKKKDGD